MRPAGLIAWLIVGLSSLGEISSALGAGVSALVVDVSQVGDGSVEQAVLEAQRQAVGWGPAYRSSNKDEHTIFSGKFIPPELPEEKKGQYAYGLAVLSDDGCNVKVGESIIHQRVGQRQHLPSLGESFHELQVILAPGESVDLQVEYSNVIYDDDPKSPGYPDIDGCSLFLYLIPMGIAVDANRDGTIAFSGENRDSTSEQAPFRFWCNDDYDGLADSEGDHVGSSVKDYEDGVIQTQRDLEDFARVHISLDAFRKELAEGVFRVGLKFKDVEGEPKIKIYKASDPGGSDSYLKSSESALHQIFGKDAKTLGEVTSEQSIYLPKELWTTPGGKKCLIFEAAGEGKGRLMMAINKSDGVEIGRGPSVWLDLNNIKKLYQRYDGSGKQQWKESPFIADPNEEGHVIVFVHGWRMSPATASSFAETFYKRLWHQGFKGRFAAFRWDTYWSDDYGWVPYAGQAFDSYFAKYNDSEHNAWLAGSSLASFVNALPSDYAKNVAAHSMGNVVLGSALLEGANIENCALMQAAVPAACFDEDGTRIKQTNRYNHLIFTMWDNLTPDDDPDPAVRAVAYRGRLKDVKSNLVNFCLPQDYATSFAWEINNDQTKPPNELSPLVANFRYNRYAWEGTKLYKYFKLVNLEILDHFLTDPYEAMPYACRTWGKAIGAEVRAQGAIDDLVDLSSPVYNLSGESSGFGVQHSGQFNGRVQQLRPFYRRILEAFDIATNL